MKYNLLDAIKRKGFLEVTLHALNRILGYFVTKIKICWLRAKGYNFDYSIALRGNNTFFQSYKGSIKIGRNSDIGHYVKICTGSTGSINIGEGVGIYDNTHINIQDKLEIGNHTLIAPFCYIVDYDHINDIKDKSIFEQGFKKEPIIIGKNVWIGAKTVILKGVKIGDHSVIGAGSVVTRDIPPNSIAAGNPARVIKKINNN